MKTKKAYRSKASAAIHETVEGLYGIGLIDKQTMQEFDDGCLYPQDAISALEEREQASQTIPSPPSENGEELL